MNRKQLLLISIAGASLLAITTSHMVWSKGHVPLNKVQVCHKGKTRVIDQNKLGKALKKGDCLLPACDFANTFMVGNACPMDATDGFCDVPNTPNFAHNLTTACRVPH